MLSPVVFPFLSCRSGEPVVCTPFSSSSFSWQLYLWCSLLGAVKLKKLFFRFISLARLQSVLLVCCSSVTLHDMKSLSEKLRSLLLGADSSVQHDEVVVQWTVILLGGEDQSGADS